MRNHWKALIILGVLIMALNLALVGYELWQYFLVH